MTQDRLDRLVIDANPVGERRIGAVDLDSAERELLAEILASSDASTSGPLASPRRKQRRPRLRLAFGLGALAVVTVAAFLLIGRGGDGAGGGATAYAAEAIAVAEENRRLLVGEEGWDVYYASFQGPEYGEVGFEDERGIYNGGEYLDMNWYADEREIATRSKPDGEPVTVAGEPGYFYAESPDSFVAVLPGAQAQGEQPDGPGSHLELGETGMLIKGVAASPEQFRARLESIVSVDVDTWLAAMPRSVVQPIDQASEIDRLLQGVPLPPDFDREGIAPSGLPEDRYQLTAYVLRGAYCAWLDRWWFAQKAGDDAEAAAAIDVLLDAENWPAVRAQAAEGSLDQDFRQYANTVADGYGDKAVYDQMQNCIEY